MRSTAGSLATRCGVMVLVMTAWNSGCDGTNAPAAPDAGVDATVSDGERYRLLKLQCCNQADCMDITDSILGNDTAGTEVILEYGNSTSARNSFTITRTDSNAGCTAVESYNVEGAFPPYEGDVQGQGITQCQPTSCSFGNDSCTLGAGDGNGTVVTAWVLDTRDIQVTIDGVPGICGQFGFSSQIQDWRGF